MTTLKRPIFFDGRNALAIGLDMKTQTRRPFQLPPGMEWYDELGGERDGWYFDVAGRGWWNVAETTCCYGQPGDRLGAIESTFLTRGLRRFLPFVWCSIWPRFVFAWLDITNIRTERLHEISEQEFYAEGLYRTTITRRDRLRYRPNANPAWWHLEFARVWNRFYGDGKFRYEFNPWVFVIEFKRRGDDDV